MKNYVLTLLLLAASGLGVSGCAIVRLPVEAVQLTAIASKASVTALRQGRAETTPLPISLQLSVDYHKIAATSSYVTAIKSDGTLWVWGRVDRAAPGKRTMEASTVPYQLPGMYGFKKVEVGFDHFLALNQDGTVWGWGFGQKNEGQLGEITESLGPVRLEGLRGVVDIAASKQASAFLDKDGRILLLGHYQSTWDTRQNFMDYFKPTELWKDTRIRKISMHGDALIAILDNGDAMIWDDDYIWLTDEERKNYRSEYKQYRRQEVHLERPIISALKVGAAYLFLLDNGNVMARGVNLNGALGQGGVFSNLYMTSLPMPVDKYFQVKNLGHIVSLVQGMGGGAAALDDQGRIWHWGDTLYISPLTGFNFTNIPKNEPVLANVAELHSIGGRGYAALIANGDVYFWGNYLDDSMHATGDNSRYTPLHLRQKRQFVPVKSTWQWK